MALLRRPACEHLYVVTESQVDFGWHYALLGRHNGEAKLDGAVDLQRLLFFAQAKAAESATPTIPTDFHEAGRTAPGVKSFAAARNISRPAMAGAVCVTRT